MHYVWSSVTVFAARPEAAELEAHQSGDMIALHAIGQRFRAMKFH